uniref:Ig-like domain-containing protein n=1 Tax=Oryctolagus cuniculus TaxID=9986 RepID=A0A5F9DFV0_RABIT
FFKSLNCVLGLHGKSKVKQSPQYLSAREGEFLTIDCSYSTGMTTLHWLQQTPGGGIVSLFILSLEMKKNGRMSATINTKESQSSLHITASQLRDSATYLCAVGHSASQAPAAHTQTQNLRPHFSFLSFQTFC